MHEGHERFQPQRLPAAYNVVGYMGSGSVTYGAALAAVFLEGWVFLLLSITGVRARLFTCVPGSIRLGMNAGQLLNQPRLQLQCMQSGK